MGYDWREKCPLNGAERYLYKRFKKFPSVHLDWNDMAAYSKAMNERDPLHVYYQDGWEYLRHLEDLLFSTICGGFNRDWIFSHQICKECGIPAQHFVNQVDSGRKDESGDNELIWLPDAPRFLCYPHYHLLVYEKRYVPPTLEESRRQQAMFRAMERMHREQPPQAVKLNCGIKINSFTIMDRSYLERLVELAKEEYDKLCNETIQ
jgi:hypothetical protein